MGLFLEYNPKNILFLLLTTRPPTPANNFPDSLWWGRVQEVQLSPILPS